MSEATSVTETKGLFPATHWTVVLAAGGQPSPQSQAALETLCRPTGILFTPLCVTADTAPKMPRTWCKVFSRGCWRNTISANVERERGRFRCFLLAALRHFLANEWDRERAAKRGGGARPIPLDEILAERQFAQEPGHELTAEKLYERSWAWTVLEQVRTRLRMSFAQHDKSARFELLEKFLPGEESDLTCAEVGARLDLSEGTIKAEIHRLRQRYRALLREEIAQTVETPDEVTEEIRHLIAVVSG